MCETGTANSIWPMRSRRTRARVTSTPQRSQMTPLCLIRDWECSCGKYKRIKHKGVICDRCGVEVTLARVRRELMGHIELAVPVSHIWFYKCMPSRLGLMLDMSARQLERVIYYEDYIVIDPGKTPLQKTQLLNEVEYREAQEQYGEDFVAGMGGEAVKKLLSEIELNKLNKG